MTEYIKQINLPNGLMYQVLDPEAARIDHTHDNYLTQITANQLYAKTDHEHSNYLTTTAAADTYLTQSAAEEMYGAGSQDYTLSTTTGTAVTGLTTETIDKISENTPISVLATMEVNGSSVNNIITSISPTTTSASYISNWNAGDTPIKSLSTASINQIDEITSINFDATNFERTSAFYQDLVGDNSGGTTVPDAETDSFYIVNNINTEEKAVVTGVGSPEILTLTASVSGTELVIEEKNNEIPINFTVTPVHSITGYGFSNINTQKVSPTVVADITTASITVATGGVTGAKPSLTYSTITPITNITTTTSAASFVTHIGTTSAIVNKITTTPQTIATGISTTAAFVKSVELR